MRGMQDQIASAEAAAQLCAEILDPARTAPIVGVCLSVGRETPLVDVDLLSTELEGRAAVRVLATGEASWELKRSLPPGLDVYGDALRVWQPGIRTGHTTDHPLLLLDVADDRTVTARRVVGLIERGAHLEKTAIVSEVTSAQATLRLTDGTSVVVPNAEISRHDLPANQVLRLAQAVRVLIIAASGADAPRGSLLPFEPDPRRRFIEQYGIGAVVLGRVDRLHNFGALVELLPGLLGLVRVGRISEHWVDHPQDVLAIGDLITVRVVDLEGEKIELSLRGTDPADRAQAASLYPDGPPWLTPPAPAIELPAHELPALSDHEVAVGRWETPVGPRVVTRGPFDRVPAVDFTELRPLEDLVLRAAEMHERSRRVIDDSERHLAHMRSAAARLRSELETDLVELRERVLRTAENEYDEIQGSTREALDDARTEIRRLRELLEQAGRAHDELEQQARTAAEQARKNSEALRRSAADADRQRALAQRLQSELETFVPAEERLRAAVRNSWIRQTTRSDRERFRWREPVVGPEFLDSLESLEGVSRDRVVDVCAEVVSGRAVTRPGLQVHALRSVETGGSPQQQRADGARAFRASLQVRSSAARRLHYWELPDGGIELAKVGYHDDFTIR